MPLLSGKEENLFRLARLKVESGPLGPVSGKPSDTHASDGVMCRGQARIHSAGAV